MGDHDDYSAAGRTEREDAVDARRRLEWPAGAVSGQRSRAGSLRRRIRPQFRFGANEVPDIDGATREIERYLKLGGVVIAEQKFGVECDSKEMQRVYRLAGSPTVCPVLMHWQFEMYNYGFERFHTMLDEVPSRELPGPCANVVGNIDQNYTDQKVMYPKGPVTRGGLTDRYLSDYPNMFGDMSAGSGLNALTRDEEFAQTSSRAIRTSSCTAATATISWERDRMPGRADHRRDPATVAEQGGRAKAAVWECDEVVSTMSDSHVSSCTGLTITSKKRRKSSRERR